MLDPIYLLAIPPAMLAIELVCVGPRSGNKFGDCSCKHLELCPFYDPPQTLDPEFDMLRDHLKRYHADSELLNQLALMRDIHPEPPSEPFRFRGLDWDARLRRAEVCRRICKHYHGCWIVQSVPQYIMPAGPRGWSQGTEPGSYVSPDGQSTTYVRPVPNPEFDRLAYRPATAKKDKPASSSAARSASSSEKNPTTTGFFAAEEANV